MRISGLTHLLLSALLMLPFSPPSLSAVPWDGPSTGPSGQPGKRLIYLAEDMRNGGITAVYRGLQNASSCLGWALSYDDAAGEDEAKHQQFQQAILSQPDAIILGGFDVDDYLEEVQAAHQAGIILVGWHAAKKPGPTADLFVNITTEPNQVAEKATRFLIQQTHGNIGVVLFNDARFDVANAKTEKMKELLSACDHCQLLATENVPISLASQQIPELVTRLDRMYGRNWTHSLAINDLYFDSMNYPLRNIGRTDIQNVSAGDGSSRALSRIKSGHSQQIATVAEPLTLQGWQLADEINRALAGQAPSGYVASPILVTSTLLQNNSELRVDDQIPYIEHYQTIWQCRLTDKTKGP